MRPLTHSVRLSASPPQPAADDTRGSAAEAAPLYMHEWDRLPEEMMRLRGGEREPPVHRDDQWLSPALAASEAEKERERWVRRTNPSKSHTRAPGWWAMPYTIPPNQALNPWQFVLNRTAQVFP